MLGWNRDGNEEVGRTIISVHGQNFPPTRKVCTPHCATCSRFPIHGVVANCPSASNDVLISAYFASAAVTVSFAASTAAVAASFSSASASAPPSTHAIEMDGDQGGKYRKPQSSTGS